MVWLYVIAFGLILDIAGVSIILLPTIRRWWRSLRHPKEGDFYFNDINQQTPQQDRLTLNRFMIGFGLLIAGFAIQIYGNFLRS